MEIPDAGYSFEHLKNAQAHRRHADAARARPARSVRVEVDGPDDREEVGLMQLGFVGLGKMGGNMVHRIHRDSDHECVVFDHHEEASARRRATAPPAPSRSRTWSRSSSRRGRSGSWCRRAIPPRDGGGAGRAAGGRRHDRRRRQLALDRRQAPPGGAPQAGIHYVDVGVSGGVWGLSVGYCMMVGGRRRGRGAAQPDPRRARPAGHRGARAGLGPLRADRRRPLREDGPQRRGVRDDAGLRRGLRRCSTPASTSSTTRRSPTSGCRARWCARGCASWPRCAFEQEGNELGSIAPYVEDSGEGRWTVEDAIDKRRARCR